MRTRCKPTPNPGCIAIGGAVSLALTAAVVLFAFGACSDGSSTGPDPDAALFEDDFESGLTKWSGRPSNHNEELVPDPLGTGRGTVVHFTDNIANGDIFSTAIPLDAAGTYVLSFDYLGLPQTTVPPGGLGGFIGIMDDLYAAPLAWIAGTEPGQAPKMLIDDGASHSYSISFTPSTFFVPADGALHIMLEDFEGSGAYAAMRSRATPISTTCAWSSPRRRRPRGISCPGGTPARRGPRAATGSSRPGAGRRRRSARPGR